MLANKQSQAGPKRAFSGLQGQLKGSQLCCKGVCGKAMSWSGFMHHTGLLGERKYTSSSYLSVRHFEGDTFKFTPQEVLSAPKSGSR